MYQQIKNTKVEDSKGEEWNNALTPNFNNLRTIMDKIKTQVILFLSLQYNHELCYLKSRFLLFEIPQYLSNN